LYEDSMLRLCYTFIADVGQLHGWHLWIQVFLHSSVTPWALAELCTLLSVILVYYAVDNFCDT